MNVMDKRGIRRQISSFRKELTEQEIVDGSRIICRKIVQMDLFKDAKCLYVYMDFRGEVCTAELVREAWRQGKRVAVPKVAGDDIVFYYIHSFEDVAPGHWGIPEPVSGETADDEGALMIVPGVAFDSKRHRCGYGKGFYDRYLSTHTGHFTVGAAFDFQIVSEVPVCENDVSLMRVVTPTVIY